MNEIGASPSPMILARFSLGKISNTGAGTWKIKSANDPALSLGHRELYHSRSRCKKMRDSVKRSIEVGVQLQPCLCTPAGSNCKGWSSRIQTR